MTRGINGIKLNSGISNGINGVNSNVSYKLDGGIFEAVKKLHELPEFKDVPLRDIEFALADSNDLTIKIINERDHIFDSSGKEISKGAAINIDLSTIAAHLKGKKLSDSEIAKLDKKDNAARMALQASGQNSPFGNYEEAINVFKEIENVELDAPIATNEVNNDTPFAQGGFSNNQYDDFLQMLLMLNFVSCFLEAARPKPFFMQNPYNAGNMGFGAPYSPFSMPNQGYFPMNFLT
jgi:hypothetical protein